MSIKYRLYGAFGILILVTLGLVIYGAWVFGDIGPVIIRMNSIATNNARTLQAAEHLEILRRTVLRYVYDRDPAARQENGEIRKRLCVAGLQPDGFTKECFGASGIVFGYAAYLVSRRGAADR